jgi:cyanophycin synthetase
MIRLLETTVYVGPNLYVLGRAIRLRLDLGAATDATIGPLGLADALDDAVPGLHERLGARLDVLTLGEAVAETALQLQLWAECRVRPVALARVHGGACEIVYAYDTEEIGIEAGRLARETLRSVAGMEDAIEDFDIEEERRAFLRFVRRRRPAPSTGALIAAAEARDIPWIAIDESLIQLGHGRHQRRVASTYTSLTPHIAVNIARDRMLCHRLLGDLGLPVAPLRLVRSAEAAVAAAERFGYPVSLALPDDHDSVQRALGDEWAVDKAFALLAEEGDPVLVEGAVPGFEHQLLVVDGALVAATLYLPGHVRGDGQSSIAALIDQDGEDSGLALDEDALSCLAEAGLSPEHVPADGDMVWLRRVARSATGGSSADVLESAHPDIEIMAARAVRAIGLDTAAITYRTPDIAESWRSVGGAILEVEPEPSLRAAPEDAAGRMVEMLFPPGAPSRVPIAALTGTNGKTTTVRMLAHILKFAGHTVGLTTTDAVYVNGALTVKGDMTGPVAANMVLKDPSIDMAVLETARGGLVRAGLGYDSCDVGAVLNVTADHIGMGGIESVEELALVKRLLVEVARDTAVLNADDPLCLRMADHTPAKHIAYVTRDMRHALVREHIRAGGRAAVLEQGVNGDQIVLYDKGQQMKLIWAHLIPATFEGKAAHNVTNAMFAASMAYALGQSLDAIRNGLRTFDMTFFQAPGRLNVYDEHGFRVILDYGHNPAAMQAMVDTVNAMAPKGKRIVVVMIAGDRRDADIDAVAALLAPHFDHFIAKQNDDRRGRADGELPELVRESLIRHGVDPSRISVTPPEEEAVEEALAMAAPDDLVLIFGEKTARCWQQIVSFGRDTAEAIK